MLTNETINTLLGTEESYQAPQAILRQVLDTEKREKIFRSFLEHEWDVSKEWFSQYFEEEHSDRKKKKQDFTPQSVSEILAELTDIGSSNTYFESAAGTGGIMIQAWCRHREKAGLFKFDPRSYWYQVEELSDRAVPFLIFNMAIRGMCGVVIHGDSLTRETKEVYFIRNDSNNYLGFSEVIQMPHTAELEEELNIVFVKEGMK